MQQAQVLYRGRRATFTPPGCFRHPLFRMSVPGLGTFSNIFPHLSTDSCASCRNSLRARRPDSTKRLPR